MPRQLEERIVKYRNAYVEHVEEPRLIFGTSWGPDRRARIIPNVLYPAPGEVEKIQHSTADLDELLASLDSYMTHMLDLLDANADKSILPPAAGT